MDSEKVQLLCAHHNRLLPEGSLQVTPVPLPPRAIKLIRHDLKHDDVVPLRLATLLPQALRGSARERSQSAVLARELLAHPDVPRIHLGPCAKPSRRIAPGRAPHEWTCWAVTAYRCER